MDCFDWSSMIEGRVLYERFLIPFLHYRRVAEVTSDQAEHCLSVASCAGALATEQRGIKIMQGDLSFCFVFLWSSKKNDVAAGESFCSIANT